MVVCHRRLDLLACARQLGEVLDARGRDEDVILNADAAKIAEPLDLLLIKELARLGVIESLIQQCVDEVHAGLHGDHYTLRCLISIASDRKESSYGLQNATRAEVLDARLGDARHAAGVAAYVVRVQAEQVAETMREEDGLNVVLEHLRELASDDVQLCDAK